VFGDTHVFDVFDVFAGFYVKTMVECGASGAHRCRGTSPRRAQAERLTNLFRELLGENVAGKL